jgi:hypothetical protein
MATKKDQQFRVGKINIIKSLARKPKGLVRKTLIEKPKILYSRNKQKQELKKIEQEES